MYNKSLKDQKSAIKNNESTNRKSKLSVFSRKNSEKSIKS